jgi:hypothetical protein
MRHLLVGRIAVRAEEIFDWLAKYAGNFYRFGCWRNNSALIHGIT